MSITGKIIKTEFKIARKTFDFAYGKYKNAKINEIRSRLDEAMDNFYDDGDLTTAIAIYEDALINSSQPLLDEERYALFLVDLYKKAGEGDKAWMFLSTYRMPARTVYQEKAKIKSELKQYPEAIKLYMLYFYENYKNYRINIQDASRTLTPLVEKAGYPNEDVNAFIQMIIDQISDADPNGAYILSKKYSDYIKYRKYVQSKK